MRALWTVLVALVLLHVLAALGGVGYLWASGRLDRDRVRGLVETFKLTIEEEKQQVAEAEALAEENRKKQAELARLEGLKRGPVTLADQLQTTHQDEDASLHKLNRMRREIGDLQRQVEIAKELIAKQRAGLEAERGAFDERVRRYKQMKEDGDFRRAVRMYESLKPKMAKRMFRNLLAAGEQRQVVNYLAAMKMRKAAGVLNEFKTPEEVAEATDLVRQLRERGLDPTGPGELASNIPVAGAGGAQ